MPKRWRDSEKKKQKKRKVLPGFPWQGKFQTKEEVDAYFAGDKIQCLLCGKWYQQLCTHLTRIHEMTSDEYRELYGLPWMRGLTAESLHKKQSETTKQLRAEGRLFTLDGKDEQIQQKAKASSRKPFQPFERALLTKRAPKKTHTIEQMHQLAKSRGGKCLSETYHNTTTKLLWKCAQGHQWAARPHNIQHGGWCPTCARIKQGKARRLSIEEMRRIAESRGGKCLSETYSNNKTKLLWECVQGHQWATAPDDIKRGRWCPTCARIKQGKARRLSIEEMYQIAESRGGKCLSETYSNSRTKLLWECAQGHQWTARPCHIKRGQWCPTCARIKQGKARRRLGIEEIRQIAKSRGGKCLSKTYSNSRTKLLWECAQGHQWTASPYNIKYGRWCPYCAGTTRLTIEGMRRIAKDRGGQCLSPTYTNNRTKLVWQCAQGHQWEAAPNDVKRGTWCPYCAGNRKKTI